MDWSAYIYLVGVVLAGAGLLAAAWRALPALSTPSRTRTRTELLVLAGVVAVGLAAIYFNFYRGAAAFAYLDVGNDTSEQYVPYYLNMLDAIRNGTMGFWNFDYGLGVSFMSYQSWTLDPFNLVLVPLGLLLGNERLALVLVIVQSLKVAAVAFLFDHLLTYYCERPLARILGAALCAFSGYLMLWGQHYWLGTVFVMATLIPLLLERLMERWTPVRFVMLALAVALSIVSSIYSGFMVMLFATVYALLRVGHVARGGVAGYLRLFGRLALPVVCGIFISLAAVIPYASLMLGESTRVTGGDGSAAQRAVQYLGSFVPLRWLPMILSRALGNGLVSYGDPIAETIVPATDGFAYVNVYEIIMLGLSGAVLILLSQFLVWAVREADRRDKILFGIAGALIVLYCVNFFLPALSNALVNPKYRSSFAVVIPVCIAMAVAWDKRVMAGRVARVPLAVSAVLSLAVVAWSLTNTIDGRLACLWYLVAICAITALLWFVGTRAQAEASAVGRHGATSAPSALGATASGALLLLCCGLIISTSVVDGFFSTNNRDVCSPANFPGTEESTADADTVAALAWLKESDPSFWRVEKTYSDWTWLNDGLVQHYSGVSSYNPTLDSDVEEFYAQLWPGIYAGDTAYQSFGNDPDRPAQLGVVGVKYLLSREPVGWDWCRELTQIGEVHVYRNIKADSIATVRSGVLAESDAAGMDAESRATMLAALTIVPDEQATVLLDREPRMLTMDDIANLDLSWMELEEWELNADGQPAAVPASQARIVKEGGSAVSGTVFANANSVVCLSIPHVSGWTVRVDGQEVETFRANYGFIGFAVDAGVHQIEASFAPPRIGLSLALSAAGVALTAVCCVVISLRKRGKEAAASVAE